MKFCNKTVTLTLAALCAGCGAFSKPYVEYPGVAATAETTPVRSVDDAADDPAIWVHPTEPEKSLVLGTDKQAGLYVYDLSGAIVDFEPAGRLNNVDVRQNASFASWTGDLAAASNRTDNSVSLFSIDETGAVQIGGFPAGRVEPYGLCMGVIEDAPYVFVTYKTGEVDLLRVNGENDGERIATLKLDSQLEGCVHDDAEKVLYVGEENAGIWKVSTENGALGAPEAIDVIGGASNLVADVEGLSLYHGADSKYLVASSQGDNSYAIYEIGREITFKGKFRVLDGAAIDATEETDGIAITAAPLGDALPDGAFVAQDGLNKPAGQPQNFKIVDWREIEKAIALN